MQLNKPLRYGFCLLIILENIITLVNYFSPSIFKATSTVLVLIMFGLALSFIISATIIAQKKPELFFYVAMIVYVLLVTGQIVEWKLVTKPTKESDCAKKIAFFKDYAYYNWNMIK